MRHWQQLGIEERRDVLEIASARTYLPQLAVEKDWWVTMVLKALSTTRHFNLMSFKGGTSLSKGWNLINRFSEDIDIAMRREGKFSITSTSGNQLAKVRRAARHYIVRELPDEITEALNEIGIVDFSIEPELTKTGYDGNTTELRATTHPSTIFVHYKSILPEESEYSVVKHRSVFNKVENIDYDLHNPSTLSFIPPNSIIKEWEKDYQSMQRHFIYEDRSLSFDELIKRLKELTLRIRNL